MSETHKKSLGICRPRRGKGCQESKILEHAQKCVTFLTFCKALCVFSFFRRLNVFIYAVVGCPVRPVSYGKYPKIEFILLFQ